MHLAFSTYNGGLNLSISFAGNTQTIPLLSEADELTDIDLTELAPMVATLIKKRLTEGIASAQELAIDRETRTRDHLIELKGASQALKEIAESLEK